MDYFHRFADFIQRAAEQGGGIGLLLVAFFDSSFLTLPELADILVVTLSIRDPDHWLYYAVMTSTGSIAGCYTLYWVGRKGGEALVRRGIHERHIDRGLDWFRRYGALVLIVPAMMPPPMPFKLFVLLAGASGLRSRPFVVAVVVGRGLRYGGLAWLARRYGEGVFRFLQRNAYGVLWPAALLIVVAVGLWWFRRSRKRT